MKVSFKGSSPRAPLFRKSRCHSVGYPVRTVWSSLSDRQKRLIAGEVGELTRQIRQCAYEQSIAARFKWNSFIEMQYRSCVEQQRGKGLPHDWLGDVARFLAKFDIAEFQTTNEVLLHADLTFDHVLVEMEPVARISGVIDMADCQTGHAEYELVAPTAFIFKGQKAVLQQFLKGCELTQVELSERFSEKLLAWCLLHRYFRLSSTFRDELAACSAGDFKALARLVFPVIDGSFTFDL